MKYAFLVIVFSAAWASVLEAGTIEQRAHARAACRSAARSMNYAPNTVKWKNSIKACMIEWGFKGR
jgi:hypothetical protein